MDLASSQVARKVFLPIVWASTEIPQQPYNVTFSAINSTFNACDNVIPVFETVFLFLCYLTINE